MLKKDLDLLVKQLLESASLVNGMIQKSIRGLTQKEKVVLLEVIEQDEPRENELEIAIEEACIQQKIHGGRFHGDRAFYSTDQDLPEPGTDR